MQCTPKEEELIMPILPQDASNFTATGPPFTTFGVPDTGFSTIVEGGGFQYGANVAGDRAGVVGISHPPGVLPGTTNSPRESDVQGAGVYGSGNTIGVFGKTVSGGIARVAGVYGQDNGGQTGVLGAVMRGGTAVAGVNVSALGNPLATFDNLPNPGDGSGTGVYGTSGSGTGVHGTSDAGFGVHGSSTSGNGGVFESQEAAQIRLIPSNLASPEGQISGKGGELVVTTSSGESGQTFGLWFCAREGDVTSTVWELVAGTRPFPGTLIAEGAQGIIVKRIQLQLNLVAAAGLVVDGIFGPLTGQAVTDFQTTQQIDADGAVGPMTWEKLFALV